MTILFWFKVQRQKLLLSIFQNSNFNILTRNQNFDILTRNKFFAHLYIADYYVLISKGVIDDP
jgi:hypothetical protein